MSDPLSGTEPIPLTPKLERNSAPDSPSSDAHHPLSSSQNLFESTIGPSPPSETPIEGTTGRKRLTLEDVKPDIGGLQQLVKNGSWRSVMKLIEKLMEGVKYPHDILSLKYYQILSHYKMRQYKGAMDVVESLGDFDEPKNCYQTYPQYYPGLKGSMVPYALRALKPQIKYLLKTEDKVVDSLTELLSDIRKEISHLKSNQNALESSRKSLDIGDAVSPLPLHSSTTFSFFSVEYSEEIPSSPEIPPQQNDRKEILEVWIERELKVLFTLINILLQEKDYPLGIQMMEEFAMKRYPSDPSLLSALGRMYLQTHQKMGDIKSAAVAFKKCEECVPPTSTLAKMNRGYLSLALDQYTTAIEHFQSVLELDPGNAIAANNKAICLLYTCELSRAIQTLEEAIRKHPEKNLNEVAVFNLCTLYDLKSDNSAEKKKGVMSLVAKYAPDSFDFSVLKL